MPYTVEQAERALFERHDRVNRQKRHAKRTSTYLYSEGVFVTRDGRWAIICEADPEPQEKAGEPEWDNLWFVTPGVLKDVATLDDAVFEGDCLRAAKSWVAMQTKAEVEQFTLRAIRMHPELAPEGALA